MNFKKISNSGFTLVELMVVVAIIGILSAIAIPNFKKYQAKSKTSEAKLQLAALYTAEVSFSTDFDVYATCLAVMGFSPTVDAAKNKRYYGVGFSATNDGANGDARTNGATDCANGSPFFFEAGKKVGGTKVDSESFMGSDAIVINGTFDEFKAAAAGILDADKKTATDCDRWTIDQDKQLSHAKVGY